MFFSFYGGPREGADRWRRIMAEHAEWLQLVPRLEDRRMASGTHIRVGWLLRAEDDSGQLFRETADHILAITYGDDLPNGSVNVPLDQAFHEGEARATKVLVSLRRGEVAVRLPPVTPEQCLIRQEGPVVILANDFRILLRWSGFRIDPRAMYALFQYGAIPAPLTLDRNTRRVPDGHSLRLDLEQGTYRTKVVPFLSGSEPDGASRDGEESGRPIRHALDSILAKVPRRSTLLFSGGVDSGLLAARLAESGRHDVLLLNYLLGEEDAHSRAAAEVAGRLGMRLKQVSGDMAEASSALERVALDYSAPFADPAVVTTNHLAHASLEGPSPPAAVLDGTGADGAFAFGVKATAGWQRASRIPAPMRRIGGLGYRLLGSWRFQSRVEKRLRELRALSTMSLHQAAVAFAPLDGIAFEASRQDRRAVDDAVTAMFADQTAHRSLPDQLTYLDLVHTCAGRFAAKTFDPLRRYGVIPIYPYLDPLLIRAAFSIPWSEKCRNGELKTILKEVLTRNGLEGLARLPKQGFVAPVVDTLRQPRVRELISDIVLRGDNPALQSCSPRVVRILLRRIGNGKSVSQPARRFLWSLLFTSMWIHGIRSELPSLE